MQPNLGEGMFCHPKINEREGTLVMNSKPIILIAVKYVLVGGSCVE